MPVPFSTYRRRGLATAAGLSLLVPVLSVAGVGTTPLASASVTSTASYAFSGALSWHRCGAAFECSRLHVPMDYDEPDGTQVSLALIRIPATDQSHRIGSLFVNPGGPGNSGVDFVRQDALSVLPASVHRRFDIVGFDPRGVARSAPLRCFASTGEQQRFFAHVPAFPVGHPQERRYAEKMADLGRRCAALNPDLIQHLSTANVARDMDRLRQAVEDETLTYAGFSYGTFLGETYANLFPERVRALELDGILDSVSWTTGRNGRGSEVPFSIRVGSAHATSAALGFFLRACQGAGRQRCAFASSNTPAKFAVLMRRVLHKAVVIDAGQGPERFTYADIVDGLRGGLTFPPIWGDVAHLLQAAYDASRDATPLTATASAGGSAPYDNRREALLAVGCSETNNPTDPAVWPEAARLADQNSPYFGADWTFISQACATWPATDRDRYAGPFNHETAAPALLVNSRFDAAGLFRRARVVENRMPGSRLLRVNGAGHPASFTDNPCVDRIVARYLINGLLPAAGTTCAAGGNPFGG